MAKRVPIAEPELGFVTFLSYDPMFKFTCRLGDGSPTITDGFGGWDRTARPRRRALTEWNGNNPMTIEIPLLFDDWRAGESVEPAIRQLELMAGWGGDGGEPPLLSFQSGGVIPHDQHDGPAHDWVIDSIQWGDADRNVYGNRVRQAATVTVLQFVEDDVLSDESAAARRKARKRLAKKRGKGGKSGGKTYTVKRGDTLAKIAKDKLGKASRWKEIAKLNKVRDPNNIKVGQKLKMP